jgi:protocatechuate 3,4-dioxygenase beta subunit
MKKRITLVVVVLGLLAVAAFVWKRAGRGDRASSTTSASAAAKGGSGATVGGGGAGVDPVATKSSPWLAQSGAPGRRIAGRVTSQGRPVVGARVRLGNVTTEGGGGRVGQELAQVNAGPDGRFDFGVQPAAVYSVSAEFTDKTPASLVIATSDPRVKPAPDAIVLELGGCTSRLYGTIVDASGGGVAKARLTVAALGGTEASTSGEYSLCVPMGDSRVRIVADGYGALDLPIHLVGELRRDFELVPEAVLTGVVVDEAGKPVPHARVIAVPQAVEQPHFLADGAALADEAGRFRVENLAPGRFLLAARADGLGTSAPKSAVATPGTSADVTLIVTTLARVSGHVMMKGQAISGARVSVARPALMARSSYSQPDGSFVLEDVPIGTSRLDAGDYEVVTPKELAVAAARVDNVVVEVSELATLRGKVTRKGKPVPDALVQLFGGPTSSPNTRTDESGAYEIHGLHGGGVQAFAQSFNEGAAFAPPQSIQIAPVGVTTHDFELSGAAMVQGTVVDEGGSPVPNVYVRLIDPKGDIGESMTDAKGEFLCTSMLGGGDYRPAVFPSPGARTAFPPATAYAPINLADGDAFVKGIKIAIKNNRLAIAGRVLDDAGHAIPDVHIEAFGRGFGGNSALLPSVRADGSGAFVISDLAPGPYMLHAHAGDGSEVELADVPAGTKGVELRLVRPGSIEGELVGFTSTPRVHARQITAQLQIGNEAVIEGNRFSITGLTPGKYIIEALGTDQNAGQSVTVKAGQSTRVKLESKGRGTLTGTLTEFSSGAPIAGMACVAAQSMGGQAGDITGQPTPQNMTDAKGAFTIPAPIGKTRVMCFPSDGGYSAAGGDVDIPATGSATIALKAVRALPPPSDVGFRIKPLTLPLVIASVDADGPAKAGGLAVGDIVVSVDGQSVAGLLPAGAMMLAWNHRPGATLTLGIERAGAAMSIKIVAKPPEN